MAYCKGLFYCHIVFSCGTILRHHQTTDMFLCRRKISNVYGHKSLFATVSFDFYFVLHNCRVTFHNDRFHMVQNISLNHPILPRSPGPSGEIRQIPPCVTETRKTISTYRKSLLKLSEEVSEMVFDF